MIKLFWNTSLKQDDSFELYWGKYHEKNSRDWIYFLLQNVNYTSINNEKEINKEDIVIIVDSGIHFKEHFYKILKTLAKKIFLFHINDEHLDKRSKPIYEYFNYVWRTCCSPKYFLSNKVKCIPPGYKSGFKQKFDLNKKRQFKWCFFGTQHKSSRHDMKFQLEKIKPNIVNRTDKFDDETKSMSVKDMQKIYFDTNFAPCPAGFFHPKAIEFMRHSNAELYQLLKVFIIILIKLIQTILSLRSKNGTKQRQLLTIGPMIKFCIKEKNVLIGGINIC